jgi:hypothetical protein
MKGEDIYRPVLALWLRLCCFGIGNTGGASLAVPLGSMLYKRGPIRRLLIVMLQNGYVESVLQNLRSNHDTSPRQQEAEDNHQTVPPSILPIVGVVSRIACPGRRRLSTMMHIPRGSKPISTNPCIESYRTPDL